MGILDITSWQPSHEFLLEHLKPPRRKRLKLETFPRGLDGARIDVWLGEELERAIVDLVEVSLAKRMQALQIGGVATMDFGEVTSRFQQAYGVAAMAVAQRARGAMRREIYQLFHLAVVKRILLTLDRQLGLWNEGGEGVLGAGAHGSGGLSQAERLRQFRRCRPRLRYLAARDVLGILHSLDRAARKRRKSILALSWPVAEELLFNPLLQLGELGCEENFLELYPLLLLEPDRFHEMERAVLEPLREWLPEYCVEQPPVLDLRSLRLLPLRRDKGELAGYAQVEAYLRRVMVPQEYQEGRLCWLDQPGNLVRLLGGGRRGRGFGPWRHARWPAFQRALFEEVEHNLDREGLLDPLLASVLLRKIYPELGRRGTPALILDYLQGKRGRQELVSALDRLETLPNLPSYQSTLSRARRELTQASPSKRKRWLIQALEGYAVFRRDLKLAWEVYHAMERFRLLDAEEGIRLSRANGLLQDFSPGVVERGAIRAHVIIKADLRGSTELISSMNRAGINPATYFTRNLFEPLNTLLKVFGAEKVFLEGDAAILIITDEGGGNGLLVARACGFAQELIALVANRNRENRHLGLPELELGVGIAFEEGAPTYLFDEGRKITISPAIHRADRLSSSDLPRGFLELLPGERPDGWGVEEVMVRESANPVSKEPKLRRYNVNGIELDAAAFERLRQEMVLKMVATEEGDVQADRYHLGRFSDDSGKTRWLVVREAPLRSWDGRELTAREGGGEARFYEVVASPDLARRIRHSLARKS